VIKLGGLMKYTFSVFFVIVLLTLSGCTDEPLDIEQEFNCKFQSTQDLEQGLTIYKAQDGELCGSYRSGNNSIHFQTIRGENLVHGENTIDPDAPEYVVSARILDQAGNPIAVAVGDTSDVRIFDWLEQVAGLDEYNSDIEISFSLAQEAFGILSDNLDINYFKEEVIILKRRSLTAVPSDKDDGEMLTQKRSSSSWRYWIRITRKDAFRNGVPADHSAVIVNVRKPNGRILNYVTCNHGTCADSSSMNFKCQKVVYTRSQRPFSILPCEAVTSYPRHVCNDDTIVQYNMIVRGNSSLSTCYAPNFWAPSCN
jgi:hypothetical protein